MFGRKTLACAAVVAGLAAVPAGAAAQDVATGETAYGLTQRGPLGSEQRLVTFNTATPQILTNDVAITGTVNDEQLQGLDVRPATGEIYALGRRVMTTLPQQTQTLYTIDPATGVATPKSTLDKSLEAGSFGVDFNPVPDRLRVTSTAERNLRANVDTGATIVDGVLRYAPTDRFAGTDPNIVASAYTNNVAGATSTTLYGIDTNTRSLVRQDANPGVLTTIGPFGTTFLPNLGFDISGATGTAYVAAAFTGNSPRVSSLRTVNLQTGRMTLVGNIGGGRVLEGLTIAGVPTSDDQ